MLDRLLYNTLQRGDHSERLFASSVHTFTMGITDETSDRLSFFIIFSPCYPDVKNPGTKLPFESTIIYDHKDRRLYS